MDKIIAVLFLISCFFVGSRLIYLGIKKGIIEKEIQTSYFKPVYTGQKAVYGGLFFIALGVFFLIVGFIVIPDVIKTFQGIS